MQRSTYFLAFLTVAVFLLSAASVVKADVVDPKIGLGPTGSSGFFSQSDCFPSEGPSGCSFTTDGNGMTTIDITNDSEAFFVQDTVTMRSDFSSLGPLTCPTDPETAPGWTGATSPDGQSCVFTGGFISPGHPYGLTFSLFAPNTTYLFDLRDVTSPTPPVPEPGTIILLGTGLASVAAGRKKLNGAKPVV
jgi:hypothetical protein